MSVQTTVTPSDRRVFDDALALLNASQKYHDAKVREFNEGNVPRGPLVWANKHLNEILQTVFEIEYVYNQRHANDDVRPWVEFVKDSVTHVWSYNIAPYERKEND